MTAPTVSVPRLVRAPKRLWTVWSGIGEMVFHCTSERRAKVELTCRGIYPPYTIHRYDLFAPSPARKKKTNGR